MTVERRRDNQQWLLDYLVKTTGRVQNFGNDERQLPAEVKSYAMIPRVLQKHAQQQEQIAQRAAAAGHTESARDLYWRATQTYIEAQHAIFEDDDPEKIYLHGKVLECYDRLIETSEYPIERVEIAWGEHRLQGLLHLLPDRRRAPTILLVPGMDMTKESLPSPLDNLFVKRGVHVLALDGPGQGISNLRKIRVDADNYAEAGRATLDYLVERREVDPDQIALLGLSMGSYWAPLIASRDGRVKACASAHACYGDKTSMFEQASPRFKQVFMYMAGVHDEAEFDRMAERMTLLDRAREIACPMLMVTGEYDPLCPIHEGVRVYDELVVPKELWVFENEFHRVTNSKALGGAAIHGFMVDWLKDAMAGRFGAEHAREVLIPQRGLGPYHPDGTPIFLPGRAQPSALEARVNQLEADMRLAANSTNSPERA
jgi:pimeloyl-ACP methyl ester carboxylesterase